MITIHGLPSLAMAVEEWERLKRRDRQVFHTDRASAGQLTQIIDLVSKSENATGV